MGQRRYQIYLLIASTTETFSKSNNIGSITVGRVCNYDRMKTKKSKITIIINKSAS